MRSQVTQTILMRIDPRTPCNPMPFSQNPPTLDLDKYVTPTLSCAQTQLLQFTPTYVILGNTCAVALKVTV